MGEPLERILSDLHGETCVVVKNSTGYWVTKFGDGSLGHGGASKRAIALRALDLLAESGSTFDQEERSDLVRRLTAWLRYV